MDRRTFIKYSLVGLGVTALGPSQGADRPDHEIRLEQLRVGKDELGPKPVVIGVGAWGVRLGLDLAEVLDVGGRTSIYVEQTGSHQAATAPVASRTVANVLGGSAIAVLALSRVDADACEAALRWCRHMQRQDVSFKAAVVHTVCRDLAEIRNDPVYRQLRELLDVIVIQPHESHSGASSYRYLRSDIQSVRTLLVECTMSCIGLGELKQVFNHGKLAVVTSVRSLPSAFDGNPGDAVEVSLQQLGMATVDGVIIRWTDGLHLTMGDYDLLAERLSQRLPDTVTGGGVFVDIEPELDPGEPGLVHALWALS